MSTTIPATTPLTRPRSISQGTRKDNSRRPCIPTLLVLPAGMSTSSISSSITTTATTSTLTPSSSSSTTSSLQGRRKLRTMENLRVDHRVVMTRSMAAELSLLWRFTRLILLLLLGLAHAGPASQAHAFLTDVLLGPWYAWSESSSSRRVNSAASSQLVPLSSSSPSHHHEVSGTQRMSRTALSAAAPKKKNSAGFMPFFLFNNEHGEDTEDKQSTVTMDRSNSHQPHGNDTKAAVPFPPFSAFTSTLASAVVTPLTDMVIHLNHEVPKNGNKKKNDKEDEDEPYFARLWKNTFSTTRNTKKTTSSTTGDRNGNSYNGIANNTMNHDFGYNTTDMPFSSSGSSVSFDSAAAVAAALELEEAEKKTAAEAVGRRSNEPVTIKSINNKKHQQQQQQPQQPPQQQSQEQQQRRPQQQKESQPPIRKKLMMRRKKEILPPLRPTIKWQPYWKGDEELKNILDVDCVVTPVDDATMNDEDGGMCYEEDFSSSSSSSSSTQQDEEEDEEELDMGVCYEPDFSSSSDSPEVISKSKPKDLFRTKPVEPTSTWMPWRPAPKPVEPVKSRQAPPPPSLEEWPVADKSMWVSWSELVATTTDKSKDTTEKKQTSNSETEQEKTVQAQKAEKMVQAQAESTIVTNASPPQEIQPPIKENEVQQQQPPPTEGLEGQVSQASAMMDGNNNPETGYYNGGQGYAAPQSLRPPTVLAADGFKTFRSPLYAKPTPNPELMRANSVFHNNGQTINLRAVSPPSLSSSGPASTYPPSNIGRNPYPGPSPPVVSSFPTSNINRNPGAAPASVSSSPPSNIGPENNNYIQPPPPKRVPVKSAFHAFTTPFQFKEPEETPSFDGRAPGQGNLGLFGVNKQAYRPGMNAVRRVGNGDASPLQDPMAAGADPSLAATSGIVGGDAPQFPAKTGPDPETWWENWNRLQKEAAAAAAASAPPPARTAAPSPPVPEKKVVILSSTTDPMAAVPPPAAAAAPPAAAETKITSLPETMAASITAPPAAAAVTSISSSEMPLSSSLPETTASTFSQRVQAAATTTASSSTSSEKLPPHMVPFSRSVSPWPEPTASTSSPPPQTTTVAAPFSSPEKPLSTSLPETTAATFSPPPLPKPAVTSSSTTSEKLPPRMVPFSRSVTPWPGPVDATSSSPAAGMASSSFASESNPPLMDPFPVSSPPVPETMAATSSPPPQVSAASSSSTSEKVPPEMIPFQRSSSPLPETIATTSTPGMSSTRNGDASLPQDPIAGADPSLTVTSVIGVGDAPKSAAKAVPDAETWWEEWNRLQKEAAALAAVVAASSPPPSTSSPPVSDEKVVIIFSSTTDPMAVSPPAAAATAASPSSNETKIISSTSMPEIMAASVSAPPATVAAASIATPETKPSTSSLPETMTDTVSLPQPAAVNPLSTPSEPLSSSLPETTASTFSPPPAQPASAVTSFASSEMPLSSSLPETRAATFEQRVQAAATTTASSATSSEKLPPHMVPFSRSVTPWPEPTASTSWPPSGTTTVAASFPPLSETTAATFSSPPQPAAAEAATFATEKKPLSSSLPETPAAIFSPPRAAAAAAAVPSSSTSGRNPPHMVPFQRPFLSVTGGVASSSPATSSSMSGSMSSSSTYSSPAPTPDVYATTTVPSISPPSPENIADTGKPLKVVLESSTVAPQWNPAPPPAPVTSSSSSSSPKSYVISKKDPFMVPFQRPFLHVTGGISPPSTPPPPPSMPPPPPPSYSVGSVDATSSNIERASYFAPETTSFTNDASTSNAVTTGSTPVQESYVVSEESLSSTTAAPTSSTAASVWNSAPTSLEVSASSSSSSSRKEPFMVPFQRPFLHLTNPTAVSSTLPSQPLVETPPSNAATSDVTIDRVVGIRDYYPTMPKVDATTSTTPSTVESTSSSSSTKAPWPELPDTVIPTPPQVNSAEMKTDAPLLSTTSSAATTPPMVSKTSSSSSGREQSPKFVPFQRPMLHVTMGTGGSSTAGVSSADTAWPPPTAVKVGASGRSDLPPMTSGESGTANTAENSEAFFVLSSSPSSSPEKTDDSSVLERFEPRGRMRDTDQLSSATSPATPTTNEVDNAPFFVSSSESPTRENSMERRSGVGLSEVHRPDEKITVEVMQSASTNAGLAQPLTSPAAGDAPAVPSMYSWSSPLPGSTVSEASLLTDGSTVEKIIDTLPSTTVNANINVVNERLVGKTTLPTDNNAYPSNMVDNTTISKNDVSTASRNMATEMSPRSNMDGRGSSDFNGATQGTIESSRISNETLSASKSHLVSSSESQWTGSTSFSPNVMMSGSYLSRLNGEVNDPSNSKNSDQGRMSYSPFRKPSTPSTADPTGRTYLSSITGMMGSAGSFRASPFELYSGAPSYKRSNAADTSRPIKTPGILQLTSSRRTSGPSYLDRLSGQENNAQSTIRGWSKKAPSFAPYQGPFDTLSEEHSYLWQIAHPGSGSEASPLGSQEAVAFHNDTVSNATTSSVQVQSDTLRGTSSPYGNHGNKLDGEGRMIGSVQSQSPRSYSPFRRFVPSSSAVSNQMSTYLSNLAGEKSPEPTSQPLVKANSPWSASSSLYTNVVIRQSANVTDNSANETSFTSSVTRVTASQRDLYAVPVDARKDNVASSVNLSVAIDASPLKSKETPSDSWSLDKFSAHVESMAKSFYNPFKKPSPKPIQQDKSYLSNISIPPSIADKVASDNERTISDLSASSTRAADDMGKTSIGSGMQGRINMDDQVKPSSPSVHSLSYMSGTLAGGSYLDALSSGEKSSDSIKTPSYSPFQGSSESLSGKSYLSDLHTSAAFSNQTSSTMYPSSRPQAETGMYTNTPIPQNEADLQGRNLGNSVASPFPSSTFPRSQQSGRRTVSESPVFVWKRNSGDYVVFKDSETKKGYFYKKPSSDSPL